MDLNELDEDISFHHWYYRSKFLAVKDLMIRSGAWPNNSKQNFFLGDIGVGPGLFTKAFMMNSSFRIRLLML